MVYVKIGLIEKRWDELGGGWIVREVRRLRDISQQVCVLVRIDAPPVKLNLPTYGCPTGPVVHRPLNREEQRIAALWEKRGLDKPDFNEGQLQAFVSELHALI